ncbi:MAG: response regulator [Methanoregula sp.]|jgi:CheY-like chemotaxis protein|uniref:response regulator n=1 Tax=Methanoregula sp. TaxID=2052170 RepID=UPI0025D7070A|nr:response regulator [Methanoregula sp.]MCK9630928.1 response regulator [Methanoregula sp.]
MPRILLVDDDRDILDIMRLDLEDDPENSVDITNAAAEAIEKVRKQLYDVIISDWRMPGMTGTDLVRKLRNDGCSSYIILYSGYTMNTDIRTALDCGADYYLHRGGDPDQEFAELRRVIWSITKKKT